MDAQLWHDYCMAQPPEEPQRVTVREWNAMSDHDRETHVDHLSDWLYNLFMPTAELNGDIQPDHKDRSNQRVEATRGEESASITGTELRRQKHAHDEVGARLDTTNGRLTPNATNGSTHHSASRDCEVDLCPMVWIDLPCRRIDQGSRRRRS